MWFVRAPRGEPKTSPIGAHGRVGALCLVRKVPMRSEDPADKPKRADDAAKLPPSPSLLRT